MRKTFVLLFIMILMITLFSCDKAEKTYFCMPDLAGDYLGQKLPGMKTEIFAEGIISNHTYERDLAITPDGNEIYYTFASISGGVIMVTKRVNNKWTEPEIANFSRNLDYAYFEPALSPDGKKLYFLSNREPEGAEKKRGWFYQNIWVTDRQQDGSWGEPYIINTPVYTEDNQYFPSLTIDGTLYYTYSKRADRKPKIYRSKLEDGEYKSVEMLPESVNGVGDIYNTTIAPDESFLLACMNKRKDLTTPGFSDFYVLFRSEDDVWYGPYNLGPEFNKEKERAIAINISPDGKYIFFSTDRKNDLEKHLKDNSKISNIYKYINSPRNGRSDIYWISSDILEQFKPEELKK